MPKFYTVREVAEILRRSTQTIYRWIDEEYLKAKKVRDGYLIPEGEIERILSQWAR